MPSTPQETAALARGFLTDVVTDGDTDAAPLYLAGDATAHNLVHGDRRNQGSLTTPGWRVLAAADVGVAIEDVVATDDRAAVRGTVTGTHREPASELASTGGSFAIASAWFFRIDDGRITETWSLPDGLGFVQQLGAVPERRANRSLTDLPDHHP